MTAVSYPYIDVSLFYCAKCVSPPANITKGNDLETRGRLTRDGGETRGRLTRDGGETRRRLTRDGGETRETDERWWID